MFYYLSKEKTVLYNGDESSENVTSTVLINSVPNEIYNELIVKLREVKIDILSRISEIEYSPNDRYKDRFLMFMSDGNYVYITLEKITTINKYLDIVKYINPDQKGVIKLDSGQYFEEFNN